MKKECNPSYLDSFSIVLFPKLILSILTITQFSIINCLETISKDRNLENTPLKPSPYALNHPNTLISTTLSYEDYNENNQQVDIFTTVKSINLKKFDELTSNLPTTSFLANEKDYRIHTLTDSQKFEEYHSKNIINDDSQLFILKGIKTNQSNILNSIDQCLDDGKWLVNQIINVKIQQPFIVKTLKMRILKDGIKKPIECSTICCQLNNCHEISLIDQFCVTITCNHSICPFKSIDFYDSNSNSSDLRGSNVVWQLNTVYNYFDLNHLIQKSRSKSLTIFFKSEKILPLSNSKQSNSLQIFPALNEHVLSTISHSNEIDFDKLTEEQCLSTFRSPCYGFLNKPGSRNQLEQSSVNRFLINTSSLGSFNEQFQYYFKEMDLIFNDYDHCSYLIKKLLCIMVFPFCMNRVNDSLKTGYLLKEVCQEDCVHIKDEKCSMHIQKMRKIRSLKKLAPDCTLLPSKISPNLVENSCFSIIDKFKLTMKEPLNNDYDMMISTEEKPKFRNITTFSK